MLVSDRSLIRRLNGALIQMSRAYGEAKAQLSPGSPSAVLAIGEGAACFFGAGDPLNEVIGVGLEGPVEPGQIDQIERFYAEFGEQASFWVTPVTDRSLLGQLGERGYRLTEMEQVWVRPLDAPLPALVESPVEACVPAEHEAWAAGWLAGFGFPGQFGLVARAMCAAPGTTPFWVRDEGRPVAVASMTIRDGVALFYGTATLPAYRGLGYQTALLQERLRAAQAAGCEVAVVETAAANGSARNCERAGFRVLYTKVKLAK